MSMSDIADIKIDVDAHLWGWGSKGVLQTPILALVLTL
jgi:hypothetical protein